MHRLSILFALVAAMALGSNAQSLFPPKPEPYKPYLSEMALMRIHDAGVTLYENDVTALFPHLFKYYRLTHDNEPLSHDEVAYTVESVTPDYISYRTAEHVADLKGDLMDNDASMRVQLGILPVKGKKNICLTVSTMNPGGTPISDVRFFEVPPYEKMLGREDTIARNTELLRQYVEKYNASVDSSQSELVDLAVSMGLMEADNDTLTVPEFVVRDTLVQLRTDRFLKDPEIADFFDIPSGAKGKEIREAIGAIPFAMISYELSPLDHSLTAQLNYVPLVSMETAEQLKPYRRKGVKYLWDGKRYKRAPKAKDKG